LPVLAAGGRSVAAVDIVGSGRVVLIADPSILTNRYLAMSDNAAFGVEAAGSAGRRVQFAEAAHGYQASPASGLSAIPDRWQLALIVAALVALLWVWSRARRFGPPDDDDVILDPPRRLYVDAIGGALRRTHRPADALAPLQRHAQRMLDERGPAGLAPDEVDAVQGSINDDESVLALGRAAATLRSGTW
jgi:hypothetical protein